MDVKVLGPLEIDIDGTSIVPNAGKPRQILTLLALRADRIIPVSTLTEEVWGSHIPKSAQTTLQTYILQLRRRISAALPADSPYSAKEILGTRLGGYQLAGPADSCDLLEFQRMTSEGRAALQAGDMRRASDVLGTALGLWRGPALVDVPVGRILETDVLGMEESRTQALELRIEADLRLGKHAELLGELRTLTAQHPLHENFSAQLMLAHYRSGHTWRALETYQRLRGTLVRELGVEPSRRLRQLHQLVLQGSPVPAAPARQEFAMEVSYR